MKLTLPASGKPRNPFAPAAMRRRAGSHQPGASTRRQQAGRDLRRELDRLKPSP